MEKFSEDCYKAFAEILPKKDFHKLFSSLENKKQRDFGRASFMFQRAARCTSCDPDVCISLLCSAVETISEGNATIFKDWLINNKLSELVNRDEIKVKESLNRAYQDYLKDEENREGIAYNFKRFLITHCPKELRTPPIKVYKGEGEIFEIAIRAIYSRFRSLFLHESIGYASIVNEPYIDDEDREPILMLAFPLLMKVNGKYISVELTRITKWFAEVVQKSLLNYLIQANA